MTNGTRYLDPEGGFEIILLPGWSAEPDPDEGGTEAWGPGEYGVLHLIAIPQPPDHFPDPAEELYAFLDEQGVELEEDEVEDLALADDAEMALCEYLEEAEEGSEGEPTRWLIAVATAPGALVFGTYSCAEADAERERAAVRTILASLRLVDAP